MRNGRRPNYRVIGVVVFLLGAVGFAAVQFGSLRHRVLDPAGSAHRPAADAKAAPDFAGITTWINSAPLTIESLRGKVVLVDFWTYSCVNCIRTLPFLKAFADRYAATGLEVIGVHSPEFDFEKDAANVRAAVRENGVTWPVGMDNAMATWKAYGNQYWPHVYLIDRQGRIRDDYIGEGQDAAIEASLRGLLAEPGASLPPEASVPPVDLSGVQTPEIYLGYERGQVQGSLANREGYRPDAAFTYPRPGDVDVRDAGAGGRFFLAGRWTAGPEAVRAGAAGAAILLPFSARDVYVVAGGGMNGANVRLLLDGHPIGSNAGTSASGGALHLGMRDLYHVVHLGSPGFHVLELVVEGHGAEVFTFTFG